MGWVVIKKERERGSSKELMRADESSTKERESAPAREIEREISGARQREMDRQRRGGGKANTRSCACAYARA